MFADFANEVTMALHKTVNTMWLDAVSMLQRADKLHRQFFLLGSSGPRGPTWEPPADIFETTDSLSIVIALPGINPDNLHVTIEDNLLHVLAHRHMPGPQGAHLRRLEIPFGRFERHIQLPTGHFKIQDSSLSHGCLNLTLKKMR